jgi:hypothetical protein
MAMNATVGEEGVYGDKQPSDARGTGQFAEERRGADEARLIPGSSMRLGNNEDSKRKQSTGPSCRARYCF